MWALLSKRLRLYLLVAVGAPVLALLLDRIGSAIEERRGPSALTRMLCSGGDWLKRKGRGPLSKRLNKQDERRAADRADVA